MFKNITGLVLSAWVQYFHIWNWAFHGPFNICAALPGALANNH